ncbi:MAG: UDP-galactopyranose mutase [Opitutales bacterium]|nr:UDP-galactopyranose mutase [Opitutales bacterium]
MPSEYDFLVVGAGFAGLVAAEQLVQKLDARVLVVEARNHIGGNAHDAYDRAGVLIHQYGPHYFRTNSDRVRDYLSQFTHWHPIDYKVQSFTGGRYWSFPINLKTFEQLIGKAATTEEFERWLESKRIPIESPANSEEVILSQVGPELYRLFFEGYTRKQWQCSPRDLDPSVCGRIPIRTNRDDRYLRESFQALPKDGYHRLFARLLESIQHRCEVVLNTDYRELLPQVRFRHMIYTGPVDAYFDFADGHLPYRSLRFEPESFEPEMLQERLSIAGKPGFWQPEMQVNYPGNEVEFTRIVELKHATGQRCPNTTIVREYPEAFGLGKEPYYPIPNEASASIYRKYKARVEAEKHVSFIGRLATYRYYNMDQVVGMALTEAGKLVKRYRNA